MGRQECIVAYVKCVDGVYTAMTAEEEAQHSADTPAPTEEEIALAAKKAEVDELINNKSYNLPTVLNRQGSSVAEVYASFVAFLNYMAEVDPTNFG
jgi:hypothetical protein